MVGQRVRCIASTAAARSGRELAGLAGVVVYDDSRPRLLVHHWPADRLALDED